ncbi:hypothetical protein RJJ37_24840 [Rhizobium redzepovicii]|uniref:Uncharacterized protein n=1 Tax=Rhizobium redzepovicii TaxID=2867518 RepID=A0AAW8P718_9HYPH|nr:hypothetical protein [Rhizobium redzepovicii]MDR9762817.1 hypothetical protein [Rhizobium redzepovicii]MDR9780954.1 hypothetical protein [Rhizobium redzepovicii]
MMLTPSARLTSVVFGCSLLKVGQKGEHLSVTKLARGQINEHIDDLDMLKSKAG